MAVDYATRKRLRRLVMQLICCLAVETAGQTPTLHGAAVLRMVTRQHSTRRCSCILMPFFGRVVTSCTGTTV
jgi:hypothetical protein